MMDTFASYLFLFSLGAFFVPIISKCVRLPTLVGEIFYGIVLAYFFNTGRADMSVIDFLSNMGFILLMFLAGLELNFDMFTKKNVAFVLSILLFFYTLSTLFWKFFQPEKDIFYLIPYTAMSVGVLYIILKSHNIEKSFLGQNLLIVSSIGEIGTIILMIVFEIYHRQETFSYLPFLKNISLIILLFIGAYVLLRLILLFFWWFPGIAKDMSESEDLSETNVRLAILVLLTLVAIASLFKLELILGAFLAGVLLSYVFRDKEKIQNKLSSMGYGFFIPFFFIKIGWDFEITKSEIIPMVMLSLEIYGILFTLRFFLSLCFYPLMRDSTWFVFLRKALGMSLLLSAPMTLLIAIAKLGATISAIDDLTYGALIITSLIGSIVGPSIFFWIYPGPKNLSDAESLTE